MTVEQQGDLTIVHCDYCPEYVEIESDDSKYVMSELKRMEWRFQKDDNDCWENICSVCALVPGVLKW